MSMIIYICVLVAVCVVLEGDALLHIAAMAEERAQLKHHKRASKGGAARE